MTHQAMAAAVPRFNGWTTIRDFGTSSSDDKTSDRTAWGGRLRKSTGSAAGDGFRLRPPESPPTYRALVAPAVLSLDQCLIRE